MPTLAAGKAIVKNEKAPGPNGDLHADLSGVAVDGLTAADDQVSAQLLDGAGDGGRRENLAGGHSGRG